MTYGKIGDVSVDELNGDIGVDCGVGGRCRRDEGAWIVGSSAGV